MLSTSSTWSGSVGGSTTKLDSEFGFLSLASDAIAGSGPEGGLVLSLDGMVVAAVSILIAKGLSSGLLELKEKKYINLSLNS